MAAAGDSNDGDAGKMLLLISSDGEHFQVSEAAASLSKTLGHMIEDDCTANGIPLPNVTASILAKVLEYCNRHATADDAAAASSEAPAAAAAADKAAAAKASREEELRRFDAEFMDVNQAIMFDLIMAANFLNIQCLLDLACDHAAEFIKDMMPEQVRELFGIENDLTPEEEAAIRSENAWAYEI
ncbi:SKP1-like protein 5 [Oryza brachyantha]|uniref:SKP1-like protein 5 n=1 Tax=Oryza brachyantha TaxID=4533 RepID=UPI001ADAB74D|nr:SKP1-like protein 5 [Oryza brachyantha]